ncbi:MAG TPA: GNAT family N-acetyltransferase [Gemmataceae bacterium]|nr:GNAT family N-acetyltransferase [Gemmataceae bacterium]
MTISAARTSELDEAFALLYGPGTPDLSGHLAHAFRLVARGELDPDNLLVARSDAAIIGAVFCQRLAGAIAVIWPPRAVDDVPAVEDALTAAALRHVAGVKVVQAFLPPEEARRAESLLRAGFRHVARVWEMSREPLAVTKLGGAARITLVPYTDCNPHEFLDVLMRCHDDSLDCPELHGIRDGQEMLKGYRECASDPSRWWLAKEGSESVGVLILGGDELSFVGVLPERRGRGIGRALVNAACAAGPVRSVTVDARNVPAVQLYRAAGFETVAVRDVYLATLPRSAGARDVNPSQI